MSPFLIRVQQAPSCGGTLCHPLLQTLWADGGNTDVEIVRRVAQSWEEHRFFPSTLQGETGAAHGEGNHGPHREFYTLHTKSFTLFYLFFFLNLLNFLLPITIFTWSIAFYIHRLLACFPFGLTLHRRNTRSLFQRGKYKPRHPLVTCHKSRVHLAHMFIPCPAAGGNVSFIIPHEKSRIYLWKSRGTCNLL